MPRSPRPEEKRTKRADRVLGIRDSNCECNSRHCDRPLDGGEGDENTEEGEKSRLLEGNRRQRVEVARRSKHTSSQKRTKTRRGRTRAGWCVCVLDGV